MKYYCFFLFSFFFFNSLVAQQATAFLSQTRMFIGDQVELTVQINDCWTGVKIDSIHYEVITTENIEFFTLVAPSYANNETIVAKVKITCFEPSTLQIPSIPIVFTCNKKIDTLYTEPIELTVFGVEPDSTGVRPIKDIIEEKKEFSDYISYIFVVLLLLFLIGTYMYWRQNQLQKSAIITAHEQKPNIKAMRKLDLLSRKTLWQKGQYEQYCNEITYILREYLAATFGFRALEMTSSEIIAHCKQNDILTTQLADLQALLTIADSSKFAKADPNQAFEKNANESIVAIINHQTTNF